MNVTVNKKLFSTTKTLFSHITPLLKVQKTCVYFLKTLGIAAKMGTNTELVNTKNIQYNSNLSNKYPKQKKH